MIDGLGALGVAVERDWATSTLTVEGTAGHPVSDVALVDARLSGTTSRFLLPLAALGDGLRRVDGAGRLRERPMGPALDALRALGADVHDVGGPGHLPVELVGRSEEHTSELQSLTRSSYAVFCLKKKKTERHTTNNTRERKTT